MAFKITVQLPYRSNVPRDVTSSTYYFNANTEDPGAVSAAATALGGMYTDLRNYLSPVINFPGARLRVVDFDPTTGAELGEAELFDPDIDALAVGDPLPNEVSLCLSYSAPWSTPAERRRRRGRVYLGPFTTEWNVWALPDPCPRPAPALVDALCNNADALEAATSSVAPWAVWSRSDGALYNITGGWVDVAWDTQRRRDAAADSRQLWPEP